MQPNEPFADDANAANAIQLFDQLVREQVSEREPSVMSSTLSMRPDIFESVMTAGRSILFAGLLPISVKQMIVMAIAEQRNCEFCAALHRAMLESLGVDRGLIESCGGDAETKMLSPLYRQVLRFALAAADDPNRVSDDEFDKLRACGLGDEEILEVAMVASFANFLVTWTDVPASLDA